MASNQNFLIKVLFLYFLFLYKVMAGPKFQDVRMGGAGVPNSGGKDFVAVRADSNGKVSAATPLPPGKVNSAAGPDWQDLLGDARGFTKGATGGASGGATSGATSRATSGASDGARSGTTSSAGSGWKWSSGPGTSTKADWGADDAKSESSGDGGGWQKYHDYKWDRDTWSESSYP